MAAREKKPLGSPFAAKLEGYIAYKRDELNHKATTEEAFNAPSFDRFCQDRFPEKTTLDMELALGWVNESSGAKGSINRASFMREFARYLILMGEEACILPGKVTAVNHGARAPHIYTQAELDAFFLGADSIKPNRRAGLRHLIAPVFFRLLYCGGFRPYELRTLPVDEFDLDRGIVHVLDSKGKDRDVPLAADVVDMCREYSESVGAIMPGRKAFFPGMKADGFLSSESMDNAFHLCWELSGTTEFSGPKPRPYDFRHTFATDCIRRWRAEGVDVASNLKFLQEYMGHTYIESTLYYVHLVRGGLGDPTSYDTWKPSNRMREEGFYGEV